MLTKKSGMILGCILATILIGTWAVQSQVSPSDIQTADFDVDRESDWPDLTDIDIDIIGMSDAQVGRIIMIEGIENETSVNFDSRSGSTTAGTTSYPRLIFHGIFDREMRDWRQDAIDENVTKRDIDLFINNSSGRRVLRIRFYNCWPTRFALPPFSLENATRYIERMEFVYDNFEIFNS